MTAPELSRPVPVDSLGNDPRPLTVEADEAERAALARRFGLIAIERLSAEAVLTRAGEEVRAVGRLDGLVVQSCVASAAPVEAVLDEPFDLVFRPHPEIEHDEEVELGEGELDTIFYEDGAIDLGEAMAQTLLLGLDPYPRAPEAGEALKAAGVKSEDEAGPFAALASLRDKLKQ
jgi:uncharacterized metal-binding protein YceD (DUF177 family)